MPQAGGRPPSAKEMDLAMEIMAEFIFCEVDRRGNNKKVWMTFSRSMSISIIFTIVLLLPYFLNGAFFLQLTCIQQLQLAQLLCDYFAGVHFGSGGSSGAVTGPNGDTARNTLFLSLFPPTTSKGRAQALVQLVSMAISTKNKPVLDSTGIWMQQLGCTSKSVKLLIITFITVSLAWGINLNCILFSSRLVLQLADGLVKDYFVLVPKAVTRLQDLPALAPHFTSNFLSTVAEMYASSGMLKQFHLYPPNLFVVMLFLFE